MIIVHTVLTNNQHTRARAVSSSDFIATMRNLQRHRYIFLSFFFIFFFLFPIFILYAHIKLTVCCAGLACLFGIAFAPRVSYAHII